MKISSVHVELFLKELDNVQSQYRQIDICNIINNILRFDPITNRQTKQATIKSFYSFVLFPHLMIFLHMLNNLEYDQTLKLKFHTWIGKRLQNYAWG